MKFIVFFSIFFATSVSALTDLEKEMQELQKKQLEAVENDGLSPKKSTGPIDSKKSEPPKGSDTKAKKEGEKEDETAKAPEKEPTKEEICIAQNESKFIEKYMLYFSKDEKFFLNKLKSRHKFLKEKYTTDLADYLIVNLSKLDLIAISKHNGEEKNKVGEVMNEKLRILLEKYNSKLATNNSLGGYCDNCRASEIILSEKTGVIQICDSAEFDKADQTMRNDRDASRDIDVCLEYNIVDRKLEKGDDFKSAYINLLGSDEELDEDNYKGHPVLSEYDIDTTQDQFVKSELDKKCKGKPLKKATKPPKINEGPRDDKSPTPPASTPEKKDVPSPSKKE